MVAKDEEEEDEHDEEPDDKENPKANQKKVKKNHQNREHQILCQIPIPIHHRMETINNHQMKKNSF